MTRVLDRPRTEVARELAAGRLDPVDLCEAALEREAATRDVGAFVTVDADGARAAALAARARLRSSGPRSGWDGIPVALKDNLVTAGLRTTCGSRLLDDWIPPYDGAASEAMREAGAVVLGKTRLDEFGMGSSGELCAQGPTTNPHLPGHVPGGSSSGSAVAVATGAVFGALGTDTGGSIRLPAAFCGVWGLMPSYGRVSRRGVVAHASSLDRVGPLARSVNDLASLFQAIAGPDLGDATCSTRPAPLSEELFGPSPGQLVVGRPRAADLEDVDPQIAGDVEAVAHALGAGGHRVIEVELPSLERALDVYHVVASAEAASNLARFDGMRFGRRVERDGFFASVRASRGEGLGLEVQRRIRLGTWVSATAQYDAVYLQALRARTRIVRDFGILFDRVDVLLTPVASTGPFRLGERLDDPLAMYATDRWTVPSSLAGLCGLTVPLRRVGAPRATLLTAPAFEEPRLLALGRALEASSNALVGC